MEVITIDTKKRIQESTKNLILKNGYTSVTMQGISKSLNLSVGGLYYHYHSVEEILFDIVESETQNVWSAFGQVRNFETLMKAIDAYFLSEEKDLTNVNNTLNSIIYQYYFSLPQKSRIKSMNESYENTAKNVKTVLRKVFCSEDIVDKITNHIFITLHGLNFLALSDGLSKKTINYEFRGMKDFIKKLYIKEGMGKDDKIEK